MAAFKEANYLDPKNTRTQQRTDISEPEDTDFHLLIRRHGRRGVGMLSRREDREDKHHTVSDRKPVG